MVAADGHAQSLRGSAASLDRQNEQAHAHDYTYLQTSSQVRRFVGAGLLVPVRDTDTYWLKDVSFPFARPEVKTFIDRLASQYRSACGESLVVTSLTRPQSRQPRNASPRSVHPTGMAIDLRRPSNPRCRSWLEDVLLSLEMRSVLEATRERRPPHYHVALFPNRYATYVSSLTRSVRPGEPTVPAPERTERALVAVEAALTGEGTVTAADSGIATHVVRRRETLWEIARQHGITPAELRRANGLASTLIHPGQVLRIPGPPSVAADN